MEIGTGIFLSSLVIGSIALYIATRDRWRWKRILLWTTVGSVALGAGGYAFIEYQKWPRPENNLWGLNLGMPEADVRFLKGEPTKKEARSWIYEKSKYLFAETYVVGFEDNKVRYVYFRGDKSSVPTIAGMNGFIQLDNLQRLGEPTHVSYSRDGLGRIYSFDKYQAMFGLSKDGIFLAGIYDRSTGPVRFSDDSEPPAN